MAREKELFKLKWKKATEEHFKEHTMDFIRSLIIFLVSSTYPEINEHPAGISLALCEKSLV